MWDNIKGNPETEKVKEKWLDKKCNKVEEMVAEGKYDLQTECNEIRMETNQLSQKKENYSKKYKQ